MNPVVHLHEVNETDGKRVGGKCMALAALSRQGFCLPRTACVTTDAYDQYVLTTGLRPRILLELNRKPFADMRWEEIWDASLRIRNMFLKKDLPAGLEAALRAFFETDFADAAVVVRSSAPGEDAAGTSFAGLHESYVNVRGIAAIIDHIRRVWASLWSDAALLYRKELGLDVEKSAMAVVVQEIVIGDRSGVAFSCHPDNRAQGVVECVYGLNQGLVDGTVEPDRWILNRVDRAILSHVAAMREKCIVPAEVGVRHENLPPEKANRTPLAEGEVIDVFQAAVASETLFGSPQDMEWTFRDRALFILQSRPITTLAEDGPDRGRGWYLSLRRSFESLKKLRHRIESELIPAMIRETEEVERTDPQSLPDEMLADEMSRRIIIYRKWVDTYWAEFIPFAHGARLFGQVYNDAVRPEDPYEFIDLLGTSELKSLGRNRMLGELAKSVRADDALRDALERRSFKEIDKGFYDRADLFARQFLSSITGSKTETPAEPALPNDFTALVLEMANHPVRPGSPTRNADRLKEMFLSHFKDDERQWASDLLDLARASYRLRDDDNIYLGAVERQMARAVTEGRNRLVDRGMSRVESIAPEDIVRALKNPDFRPAAKQGEPNIPEIRVVKARQLIGQPAGPGVATGRARVIVDPSDVSEFKHGEILVCDAVDPNMTVVVPLAGGIVERRGGMLIHGAIIAREYGIACVTGVPEATVRIKTGDPLTVDGYLGVVTVG